MNYNVLGQYNLAKEVTKNKLAKCTNQKEIAVHERTLETINQCIERISYRANKGLCPNLSLKGVNE